MNKQKNVLKVVEVPKETKEKWAINYKAGDIKEIATETGYVRQTISRALRLGLANSDVITKINLYYGVN